MEIENEYEVILEDSIYSYHIIDSIKQDKIASIHQALKESPQTIPKIIHQVWIGPNPPPWEWIDTFRKDFLADYPEWTYYLWREESIKELKLINQELYDEERFIPGKVDILRYELLFLYGGIYIDADIVWLNRRNIDTLIESTNHLGLFVGKQNDNTGLIANSIIGSSMGNPIMKYVINLLGAVYPTTRRMHKFAIWLVTGPYFFTQALKGFGITTFPQNLFYPMLWDTGKKTIGVDLTQFKSSYFFQYGYTSHNMGQFREINNISICIAVKNKSKRILKNGIEINLFPECLKSISKSTISNLNIELVIVDFGSEDWAIEDWIDEVVDQSIEYKIIKCDEPFHRNLGVSIARKHSKFEFLLFLDPEMLIDSKLLETGISYLGKDTAYFPTCFYFLDINHETGYWSDEKRNIFITKRLLAEVEKTSFKQEIKESYSLYEKIEASHDKVFSDRSPDFFRQYYPN